MKILYIVSTLKASGPINQLFYIIKYLDREKFEPTILTLSPEPSDSALNNFQRLDIPIHSLALSRWKGFFLGASQLKSFVKKHCPDVIHTQGIRADLLSAQYLQKYQRLANIHNYAYHDYPMKYGKLVGYYSAWQHLRALRQIDLPVACSETIGRMVQHHGLNPYVIQNGVDDNLYTPASQEERLTLRQKLGLPLNQKIFISVGSLILRKNPETVIRGFIASKAKDTGIMLMLGDGPLRNSCEAIANNSPNIKFIGQVNNVVDYLKVADYFVSASLSEGLPNSVIEALSCGLPVCLSDIEPHQEILNLNKQAGVMFPVGNIEALTTQLDKLVNTQSELMSVAARSIVCEHLNARKKSENYQNIYVS